MDKFTPDDLKRFWRLVARDEPSECWEWNGSRNEYGYGQFWINDGLVRAHRFSYLLVTGEEPDEVCHECDNPPCVNPEHLWGGSHRQNMMDARRKGIRYGTVKLRPQEVVEIRRLAKKGVSFSELSRRFDVSRNAIRKAALGITWKHVDAAILSPDEYKTMRGEDNPQARFDSNGEEGDGG